MLLPRWIPLLFVAALYLPPATAQAAGFQARVRLAVEHNALPRAEATALQRALRQVERVQRVLPAVRARALTAVCELAERAALPLNRVRARVLTETLTINSVLFPNTLAAGDARAASGAVYRRYGDAGYQFQPLASFALVNAAVDAKQRTYARRLARALLARAEHHGNALVWKYYFPRYGAPPRWSSGLTQAVAAQALARVGFVAAARAAFAAITPRLLINLREGPWVRLYSFSGMVVLNAQLQTVLSLRRYARIADDKRALGLANALAAASQQLLPAFDTGWWSRYELRGGNSPLSYHRYVTSLLWKLAREYNGGPWLRHARRFRADWRERPRLSVRQSSGPVYLRSSGRHAVARLEIALSKPATLTVRIGDSASTAWRGAGPHLILWRPSSHTDATVAATILATDYAGNRGTARSRPLRILDDTTPPQVRAELVGDVLFWRAHDPLSVQLRGLVLYEDGRAIPLPPMSDSGTLALPPTARQPAWLVVADSSGNTRAIPLTQAPTPPLPPRLPGLARTAAAATETLVWIR